MLAFCNFKQRFYFKAIEYLEILKQESYLFNKDEELKTGFDELFQTLKKVDMSKSLDKSEEKMSNGSSIEEEKVW